MLEVVKADWEKGILAMQQIGLAVEDRAWGQRGKGRIEFPNATEPGVGAKPPSWSRAGSSRTV